jgi:hypothetical protein
MIILKERKEKTIELDFDGFYRDGNLPSEKHQGSGVYVVYAGRNVSGKCLLRKLLYVGESKDTSERPDENHEHYDDWISSLNSGEILYFGFADVDSEDRVQAEAAIIYHHRDKLQWNKKGTKSFGYEEVKIKINGRYKFLDSDFSVCKTTEN